MYHILIVDDDPTILSGLCKIVEDHLGSRVHVHPCENGLKASEVIKTSHIDIVITDVKMPIWSGIDLLKFIQSNDYICPVIVLSGFDDYNLVRDALKLGAVDYLLKPVDITLLVSTIKNLMNSIHIRRSNTDNPAAGSINMQMLLEFFLMKDKPNHKSIEDFAQQNHIREDSLCSLLCVDINNILYSEKLTIINYLTPKVNRFINTLQNKNVVFISGELEGYWFFLAIHQTPQLTDTQLFAPLIASLENRGLRVSHSGELVQLSQLLLAKEACIYGFDKYYYDLPYQPAYYDDYEQELSRIVQQATQAMGAYHYPQTIQLLSDAFVIFNTYKPPIASIKKLMADFVYKTLKVNPEYIQIVSKSKFTEHDIFDQISSSASLSVLQKNMFETIGTYVESILLQSADKDDFVIQKAKTYIVNNYTENITLADVASHVFLNPNYFSTLFKKKTGSTFRHYLRKIRIEQSKELIKTSNLKIYEIATAVGYNESAHFVRAFKEVTGKSPSIYKKRL